MDDLAELRKIPGKGQAKSDFITHLSFITSALTAGHPKKVVWKHLSDKQQFRASYSQFVVYASELTSATGGAAPKALEVSAAADPEKSKPAAPVATSRTPNATFKVDPFNTDILKAGPGAGVEYRR